ncbi:hypothetical protein AQ490_26065 [Wenjunlia vitaminophila]|uniref:Tetratricopeptide repeat protein n=1 Tax=Wenjunlia vitaminophila TaxID=76728 RepID=A0A0T6LQQ4_WENVI|nr:tetratricopeptide repeat protein [Wenjunlia vitaminophila]KRV48265.1 hypothetical protein AQ490_26065 [Wenjunlia vitaminophila]
MGQGAASAGAGRAVTPAAGFAGVDSAYRALGPPAARLYRLLGLYAQPRFEPAVAAAAVEAGPAVVTRCLAELTRAALLAPADAGRYRMPPVVRDHAAAEALWHEPPAARRAAVRRMLEAHLRHVIRLDASAAPGRWRLGPPAEAPADRRGGRALYDLLGDRGGQEAAVRAAEEYGCDTLVWQLCEALWTFHDRLGQPREWVALHHRGVRAAARCADPRAEARMRVQTGTGSLALGRLAQAEDEFRGAARLDRGAHHPRGEAAAVEGLGLVRLGQGRPQDALALFDAAAELVHGTADRLAPAVLDRHRSRALAALGRSREAGRTLDRAVAALRALPDRCELAQALVDLGELRLAAGSPEQARAPLDEALAILQDEGARTRVPRAARLRQHCAAPGPRGPAPR